MTADIDQNQALEEELEVLQSIYPDCVSEVSTSVKVLTLEIPIEFGRSRSVMISKTYGVGCNGFGCKLNGHPGFEPSKAAVIETLNLAHLPPLLLTIGFPSDYPIASPPTILSLKSSHSWLPQGLELKQALSRLWNECDAVLCRWVEFIQSGEFLDELGMVAENDAICIPHPAPSHLTSLLSTHNNICNSAAFAQQSFSCSICMTDLKGSRCVLLSCSHVFCRPCLQDFWGLCISEGEIGRVGCADPDCVKAGREASEEEVIRVVSDEEVTRWKWLRAKRAFERDPTIVVCPIEGCQSPVAKPPRANDEPESGWDRLRTCQSCGYSFCALCMRTWHGPISPCPVSFTLAIVNEYLSFDENSPERTHLERKYGKIIVQKLVKAFLEEESNKAWIKSSTTPCPGCKVPVEKNTGCNHMTCTKCAHHFCYRCGAELDKDNPYKHFSDKSVSCYGKLFDYVSVDDQWQPLEEFEAL